MLRTVDERVLHRATCGAGTAVLLMARCEQDCREAHEHVNNIFNHRPCADDHRHEVPVATGEITETNEAPVERTDDDKNETNTMQCFHVRERGL